MYRNKARLFTMKQTKATFYRWTIDHGIARKKYMYVRFLKRYAAIPMIEVEFAMIVAPLIAIG